MGPVSYTHLDVYKRQPNPIAKLKEDMPGVYDQFMDIANTLEKHYKDMQDMEFTLSLIHILPENNGRKGLVERDMEGEGVSDTAECGFGAFSLTG